MPDYAGETVLCEAIARVAAASASGNNSALNTALIDFSGEAESFLRPIVRNELLKRRTGGPDRMVADASDILNQFLMKLIGVAYQCQARDDSAARAWLRTAVVRLIEDEAKTPRRRFELLVKRLISLGYHHESGRTKEHPPNQQPPNQQPPNQ